MCAGLPVVTTAVGDVEYMTGKLLQLVEPCKSDKLAEGLKQMLDMSAERRAELGDALQRRVTELFSIQTMASRYQQLYQDVLQ